MKFKIEIEVEKEDGEGRATREEIESALTDEIESLSFDVETESDTLVYNVTSVNRTPSTTETKTR